MKIADWSVTPGALVRAWALTVGVWLLLGGYWIWRDLPDLRGFEFRLSQAEGEEMRANGVEIWTIEKFEKGEMEWPLKTSFLGMEEQAFTWYEAARCFGKKHSTAPIYFKDPGLLGPKGHLVVRDKETAKLIALGGSTINPFRPATIINGEIRDMSQAWNYVESNCAAAVYDQKSVRHANAISRNWHEFLERELSIMLVPPVLFSLALWFIFLPRRRREGV